MGSLKSHESFMIIKRNILEVFRGVISREITSAKDFLVKLKIILQRKVCLLLWYTLRSICFSTQKHLVVRILCHYQTCQSKPTRLIRVGSPRAGLKMSKSNPTHFLVSQKFCNPAQPTTGWQVKWVGSPTHLIFFLLFKYLNKFLSNP